MAEGLEKRTPQILLVENVPGEEKMSAVLGDFMQPYVHLAEDSEAYHKLIALAAIAWNAALLSTEKREELFRKIEPTISRSSRAGVYDLIAELMERKKRDFADNRRMILDYQITEAQGGYHLVVVSTPTAKGKQRLGALLPDTAATQPQKLSIFARIRSLFARIRSLFHR